MELNVLVLPLLGGYFFYFTFHGTAYHARRCSGQRLLFNSAIVGVALLVAARVLTLVIEKTADATDAVAGWLASAMIASAVVTVATLGYLGYRFLFDGQVRERSREGFAKVLLGCSIGAVFVYIAVLFVDSLPSSWRLAQQVIAISVVLFLLLRVLVGSLRAHSPAPPASVSFRLSLLIAAVMLAFVVAVEHHSQIRHLWNEFSPYPESGTALFAFLLGAVAVIPLNRLLFSYEAAIDRLYMNDKINAFDRLIYESTLESSQVQLTLRDGKVYVGWVRNIPPKLHESDTYLEILPVSSGYRRAETKEYVSVTFYDLVYQQYAEAANPNESGVDLSAFTKIIPISEIVVAGKFSDDAYLKFLKIGTLAAPQAEVVSPEVKPEGGATGPVI